MKSAARMAEAEDGSVILTVDSDASDEVLRELAKAVAQPGASPETAVEAFIARRAEAFSPAEQGAVITVPQLALECDGQLEIIYAETLVDVGGWNLRRVDTSLPGFSLTDAPNAYAFDIEGEQVTYRQIDVERELALDASSDWDAAALSRWLDRSSRQADVPQPIFLEYCRRVVEGLTEQIELDRLVRGKFALRRAIQARVRELRAEAGQQGVQMIMAELAPVLTLGENGFSFSKAGYDPRNPYEGPWRPVRHLFAQVGDLKHGGEQWQFASMLDMHPQVELWVRNVDRTPYSYWLPTSTDRFYPDFVARLTDGRILVAEYKGADRAGSPDSLEKKNIGERAEEVSGGKLRFLWVTAPSIPDAL